VKDLCNFELARLMMMMIIMRKKKKKKKTFWPSSYFVVQYFCVAFSHYQACCRSWSTRECCRSWSTWEWMVGCKFTVFEILRHFL